MAHVVIESLIPIFVMLGMFMLIFGVVYIRSRENMALIERGMNPRQETPRPKYFATLKYGLLILGSGLGLMMAYVLDVVIMGHKVIMERGIEDGNVHWSEINDTREPIIYFALIAIGGGLGLFLSYRAEQKEWKAKKLD
jgi:hypothetical protein